VQASKGGLAGSRAGLRADPQRFTRPAHGLGLADLHTAHLIPIGSRRAGWQIGPRGLMRLTRGLILKGSRDRLTGWGLRIYTTHLIPIGSRRAGWQIGPHGLMRLTRGLILKGSRDRLTDWGLRIHTANLVLTVSRRADWWVEPPGFTRLTLRLGSAPVRCCLTSPALRQNARRSQSLNLPDHLSAVAHALNVAQKCLTFARFHENRLHIVQNCLTFGRFRENRLHVGQNCFIFG